MLSVSRSWISSTTGIGEYSSSGHGYFPKEFIFVKIELTGANKKFTCLYNKLHGKENNNGKNTRGIYSREQILFLFFCYVINGCTIKSEFFSPFYDWSVVSYIHVTIHVYTWRNNRSNTYSWCYLSINSRKCHKINYYVHLSPSYAFLICLN